MPVFKLVNQLLFNCSQSARFRVDGLFFLHPPPRVAGCCGCGFASPMVQLVNVQFEKCVAMVTDLQDGQSDSERGAVGQWAGEVE